MLNVEITQRPTGAVAGEYLTPAIIVEHPAPNSGNLHFAQAALFNTSGGEAKGIAGIYTESCVDKVVGEGEPATLEYTFANLKISIPGVYYIHIDVYEHQGSGAVHQGRAKLALLLSEALNWKPDAGTAWEVLFSTKGMFGLHP
ncbi:hypothetical protein TrVFT333_004673 [Trichoderma virens FT-333]|nr:hypothetical protein TrVFT333_004673 [Trichoderma virens FT-333]